MALIRECKTVPGIRFDRPCCFSNLSSYFRHSYVHDRKLDSTTLPPPLYTTTTMGASTKLADLAHRTFILGVFGATGIFLTLDILTITTLLVDSTTEKTHRDHLFAGTLSRRKKIIVLTPFGTCEQKTSYSLHWSRNGPIGQCSYREEQGHEGHLGRCKQLYHNTHHNNCLLIIRAAEQLGKKPQLTLTYYEIFILLDF